MESAPCASRDWALFQFGPAGVVAQFQQAHPGVRVNFQLGTSAEVVNAVRSHHAEIGDEIVIVGPSSFKGKRLTRDDLEALTWISREEGSATRVVADNALAELGIVPKRRLALPAWEAIKIAVRRGHGITALSRLAAAEELEAGTLVVIPFVPWQVRRTMSIIRIRDAGLTPSAHQFLLMLRARCGHTFSWPSSPAE